MYNKKYVIIINIVLSLIVYFRWLNFSVFTHSDISYFFSETLRGYLSPSLWISTVNLGSPDLLIWRLPFYTLLGVLGNLGYGSNVAEKFIYFWPIIILGPLSSFLLIRKVCKDDLAGFIGSLVFAYNTYFLSINTQGHLLLTLAFIFSVFAFYFYIKYLEEKSLIFAVLTTLLLFITGFYDLRALYIIIGVFTLYLIYFILFIRTNKKIISIKESLLYFLPFILFLPLTFYWIFPVMAGISFISNENFGKLISYSEFYKITHAFSFHFPFWTGEVPRWDTFITVPWYFWTYPLFAILGLIVSRKKPNVLFFGMVALIGVLLTKQVHIPFDTLYLVLYKYIPGFNAFREASKFYFLISLGYSVLIGSFIASIFKNWNAGNYKRAGKYVLIAGVTFLSLWNTKPLITGDIGTLFSPKTIPQDIIKAKNFIFNQEEYFRTTWIHPPVRWVLASNNHPLINLNTFDLSTFSNTSNKAQNNTVALGESILTDIKDKRTDRIFDLFSVKYLMVLKDDKETNDLISNSIGITGLYVESSLNNLEYLHKINIWTDDILVYENKKYRPHIYTTSVKERLDKDIQLNSVSYENISPSEYKVTLNNISKSIYLHFTDAYHPQWGIKAGRFGWLKSIFVKDYFLPDKYHFESPVKTNSFLIDPDILCKNNNDCVKTGNGSYNIKLTLFFKPQVYLYLGMGITMLTLVSIFIIMVSITLKNNSLYAKKN